MKQQAIVESSNTSSSLRDFYALKKLEEHPKRIFLLLSGVLVLFLYWRSFTSPFVYDDLDQVVNNPNLHSWSAFVQRFFLHPVALTTSFLGHAGSTYRPLFWFSLFIDRAVWGLNPGGFHATNVVLHFLNGNLAFALLRRLRMPILSTAVASLLWLALPVDTEVVAWISGRAYLLCTLFILLCLLSALNHVQRGGFWWGLACFITAACAALSHELGIIVLPLFLLLVFSMKLQRARNLLATCGIIGVAAVCVGVLHFEIGVKSFSGLASLEWASLALWQYVIFTLLPLHMSVERSTSISLGHPHPWLVIGVVCFALGFGYAVLRLRDNPLLLGGLTWFLICITPFCVLMNYQGVAERFTYLAALGLVTTLVVGFSSASPLQLRNFLMGSLAIWSMWNLYRTSVRVVDWSDPVRLFRSSLQATPQSPSVHYNLAFSLRERGDFQEALKEYQKVLTIDERYPHAFASLGDTYLKLNSFGAAQAAYKQALAQAPDDTASLLDSGAAYQGAGDVSDAETAYRQVLQIDPASSAAHVNLGVLYMSEHKSDEAAHQFAMAIDLKTKDPVPYYDLGVLLQKAGRGDLALVLYKKVLELKPNDEDTLENIKLMQQTH
jgi:Flp pilus assembly protein TadD